LRVKRPKRAGEPFAVELSARASICCLRSPSHGTGVYGGARCPRSEVPV
jgi:hypothetical protein